jgi:hypothetical protein
LGSASWQKLVEITSVFTSAYLVLVVHPLLLFASWQKLFNVKLYAMKQHRPTITDLLWLLLLLAYLLLLLLLFLFKCTAT